MSETPNTSAATVRLSERERKALAVLAEQERSVWPGLVGIGAGDDRPSWIVGHSWRPTLFALERKGLARGHMKVGQMGPTTEFSITEAGRDAIA